MEKIERQKWGGAMFGAIVALLLAGRCAFAFYEDAIEKKWLWAIVGGLTFIAAYVVATEAIFAGIRFSEFAELMPPSVHFPIVIASVILGFVLAGIVTKLVKRRFVGGRPLTFMVRSD